MALFENPDDEFVTGHLSASNERYEAPKLFLVIRP